MACATLVLDQYTKFLTVTRLTLMDDSIKLIPGWLELTYVENPGGAWSILAGHRWLFLLAAGCACVIIPWMLHSATKKAPWSPWIAVALGLILGGAMGNLIDRTFRPHQRVIDMINVAGDWFPVFNLADSAICVGVALVFLLSIWESKAEPAQAPTPPESP